MFSKVAVLSLFASSAFATVFLTSPTESSTFTAGQVATISWQDSNDAPSLADFGDAKISIYTGNAIQQTLLQEIVPSVNVATTSSVQFTPDGTIGPNGNNYFIRVESLNLKDSENPQFPALSFSSKFTMAGMTGTFNATVQAQVDGQSTAPIGGSTSASSASSASSAAATSHPATTTSSSSRTGTGAVAAASNTSGANNGALSTAQSWMSVVAGVAAVSLML